MGKGFQKPLIQPNDGSGSPQPLPYVMRKTGMGPTGTGAELMDPADTGPATSPGHASGGVEMYVFTLMVLLGLAIMTVVALLDRFVMTELWMGIALILGIGAAWLANFDVFALWGIDLRATWISIGLTGLILGGTAYLLHEVVGLVASVFRKVADEARKFEKVHDLRRAA